MYTFLVILAVITAILLAFVVLIQESKGGGLASNVSGANSVLGVRKTTDFVEKATWFLAALLVILSVATTFFVGQTQDDPSQIVTEMPATTNPMQGNTGNNKTATPAGAARPASTPAPAQK